MRLKGACDLECQGKGPPADTREFVGPVKIVLVDTTAVDHDRKTWGSAVFTLVMMLLGATVFTVFFFTLKFQLPLLMNLHVVLCTMGFQVFMTTGILMFSTLFGGSMHLKPAERKFQHFFLEASAVLFGVLGTLIVLGSMSFTLHAVTGFLTAVFSIISSLVGPTVYEADPEKLFGVFDKKPHKYVTLPTFIMSTICFALALMKDSFMKWAPFKHLPYILVLFTFIYSGTAVFSTVLRSLLGAVLAVTALILGSPAYFSKTTGKFGTFARAMHKVFALPAFMVCNLCFILGLIKPSFQSWAPCGGLPYFLIFSCLLYSAGALYSLYLRSAHSL